MSFFASIYSDNLLSARAKSVYMYLCDRSDNERKCWPGIKRISLDLHMSRSTVKRAIADLERHGYLHRAPRYRDNGSRSSNLYTLK